MMLDTQVLSMTAVKSEHGHSCETQDHVFRNLFFLSIYTQHKMPLSFLRPT